MLYLDTSLLVAGFTHEPATGRALQLLRASAQEQVLISEWVKAEFAAALSTKIRTRQIEPDYREEAVSLFAKSVEDSMEVVEVTTAHFRQAAHFAEHHDLGLRAGDALHLAIAGGHGATLVTLDKRMAAAGEALGVSTRLL